MTVFYENLYRQYGDVPKSLGWSESGQRNRFEVLSQIIMSSNASVLDVGCGLGHFYDYLCDSIGYLGTYTGIDSSEVLLGSASGRLGDKATFQRCDALDDEPLPQADYVISSGMLNLRIANNRYSMGRLIQKCYSACQRVCAVNMLSDRTTTKRLDRFYYDPTDVLRIALDMCDSVVIRHDYRQNDFTVVMRKS